MAPYQTKRRTRQIGQLCLSVCVEGSSPQGCVACLLILTIRSALARTALAVLRRHVGLAPLPAAVKVAVLRAVEPSQTR